MTQDEKQEALYTVQYLEDRTKNLLDRVFEEKHKRHQLRLMLNELVELHRFVDSVEVGCPEEGEG